MAWNKNNPANDELLINFPAQCRANWDALEALTTEVLKITNAKVADNAAIADTKLAQITTAAKVSGAALALLPNVPSGAGVLPDANSPHKLKADTGDTTPQYLDGLIDTAMFQISAGDLLQLKDGGVGTEKLVGGAASPGNSKYYGTNAGGTKGFYDLPSDTEKVKVDSGATADYIGAGVSQGVLRVDDTLKKTDGGNYVTLGLKFYDSGWFAVSSGTNYTKTHNLGTTKVVWQLYAATDDSGSNMEKIDFGRGGNGTLHGACLHDITTTQIQIKTAPYTGIYHNYGGSNPSPGYYRIVGIALE